MGVVVRVLRGVLGGLLAVLGLAVTVVGAGAAFWLIGPDDTVYSGEQHLAVKGRSLITSPTLIDQHGPTLHVRARSVDGKPIFIGVGRNFDVASYTQAQAYTSLVQIRYPVAFTTEEHIGANGPLTAPATLDWWLVKASGPGQQSLAWPMQDGPYQTVVMSADGRSPIDVQLDLGIEIPHAFLAALAVLLIGLVLLGLSWLTFRRRPRKASADQSVPEEAAAKAPATLRTALSAVAVVSLVAGCAGLPQANTVTTLSRPAVTADTARKVLTRYDEVAAKAARTRDLAAISKVEVDDRLEHTRAAYQVATVQNIPAPAPVSFAKASIAAPESNSYPMQFAAFSDRSKTGRAFGLWNRRSAGDPWLLAISATAPADAKIPGIAGARGIRSDKTGPAATRFANYLTAGLGSPAGKAFTINREVTGMLANRAGRKAWADGNQPPVLSFSDEFSVNSSPATFLTSSGEALAFFTLAETQMTATDCSLPIRWLEGDETFFSPPTVAHRCGLTVTIQHSVVMAFPAKGNPRVVAFSSQVLKAGGY